MAELSKTARAAENAVNRGNKKEVVALTTEQIIAAIRNHLPSGLWIPREQIGVLLAEYDRLTVALVAAEASALAEMAVLEARLTAALDVNASYRDFAIGVLSEPLVIKAEPGLDPATQNLDSTGN